MLLVWVAASSALLLRLLRPLAEIGRYPRPQIRRAAGRITEASRQGMIILGIILMIIGFVAALPVLWTIGIILVVVGLILWLLGSMGHAVGGRRFYY